MDHAGLLCDDLLGAQGQAGRVLGRQGECLVEGVGVQALGAPEHPGERLDGDADQVDLGLLGGEGDAGRLGVEAQLRRTGLLRAVALTHPACPDAPGRPVLGDLLEEVAVRVEEEAEPRCEVVDAEACAHRRLDVGEPVRQCEGELLGRGGSRLTDVVAGDRHGVPARQLRLAEAHDVRDQPHRGPRREDVLLLGLVLLQDVVLNGARQAGPFDAGRVGDTHVHGQDGRGGRVDGHGRRDLAQVDAREERRHVGQGVDRDTRPANLSLGKGIIGITSEKRRHVEGGGEPVATGPEQFLEAPVRVLRRAETGELTHRPEPRAVHRRMGPAGVGIHAGQLGPLGSVDRVEGQP